MKKRIAAVLFILMIILAAAPAGTLAEGGVSKQTKTTVKRLDSASGKAMLKIRKGKISAKKRARLKKAMKKYNAETYTYGFIAINTETGLTVSYNPDRKLFSASTIKAPYMAALCKYNVNGISKKNYQIRRVLKKSDNEIYYSMFKQYGTKPINKFLKNVNVRTSFDWEGYTKTTPRNLAKMWCGIKDYLASDSKNTELLKKNLLKHEKDGKFTDYYKKGWMGTQDWSGGILNCGGAGKDWVYGILSGYNGRRPNASQDALIRALYAAVH